MEADRYWPYYCEENVWHACARPRIEGRQAFAVFVSNTTRRVAMWQQRAGRAGEAIMWDYHVVLLVEQHGEWTVTDRDCRLGPTLPAHRWLDISFIDLPRSAAPLEPLFRLVQAECYHREFCSDRSHMCAHGEWLKQPPPWPTIGHGSNLMHFVDMAADFIGEVIDLDTLRQRVRLPGEGE